MYIYYITRIYYIMIIYDNTYYIITFTVDPAPSLPKTHVAIALSQITSQNLVQPSPVI